VLTQLNHVRNGDTQFRTGPADWACGRQRALLDGCPSTPIEAILRMWTQHSRVARSRLTGYTLRINTTSPSRR